MSIALVVYYAYPEIGKGSALNKIYNENFNVCFESTFFEILGDDATHAQKTKERFENNGESGFTIESNGLELSSNRGGGNRYFQVNVIHSSENYCIDGDDWISAINFSKAIIFAELRDRDYSIWQNTESLWCYESIGVSHDHLPKKNNGLRPPLNQTIIDISQNPGRSVNRIDYPERVAADMWLGPLFEERTGADLSELEALEWCELEHWENGIMRLKACDHPFNSGEGWQAERQNKLREILFPLSKEG